MSLHSSFLVAFHLASMSFFIPAFVLFWSCQSQFFILPLFFLTDFRLWSPCPTSFSFYFLFDKTHQLPCFSSSASWSSLTTYPRSWSFLAWTQARGFLALCWSGSVWAQEAQVRCQLAATFKSICKEILGWWGCRRLKSLCGDNAVGMQKVAHAQDRQEFWGIYLPNSTILLMNRV